MAEINKFNPSQSIDDDELRPKSQEDLSAKDLKSELKLKPASQEDHAAEDLQELQELLDIWPTITTESGDIGTTSAAKPSKQLNPVIFSKAIRPQTHAPDPNPTISPELKDNTDIKELIEHLKDLNKDLPEELFLHQPTKILMSQDDETKLKTRRTTLEEKSKEISKILSEPLLENDFKPLQDIISILKIILTLNNLPEKDKVIQLSKILEIPIGKKIVAVEKILNDAIGLEITTMCHAGRFNEKQKADFINSKQQYFLIREIEEQLTKFQSIQDSLLKIENLTPEERLKTILNELSIVFNNTTLRILEQQLTKNLYEKLTSIKKLANIEKSLENVTKLIDIIELTKDKELLKQKLQSTQQKYNECSEKIDTQTEQLQDLLKDLNAQDGSGLNKILNIFQLMLSSNKVTSAHSKYQEITHIITQLKLIKDVLLSMNSRNNLLDLRSFLDESQAQDFKEMTLPEILKKRNIALFEKLDNIKKIFKEIFDAKQELENAKEELETLSKLTDYQLTTTDKKTRKEKRKETRKKPEEKLLLSNIISNIIIQLNTLEKNYDTAEYKSLQKYISSFLSKLEYTLGLIVKNFSDSEGNKALTSKMRSTIEKVKNIETRLEEMQKTQPDPTLSKGKSKK